MSDLLARVERALGKKTLAGTRAPQSVAEPLVRFRMWCSVTGKPFTVIAERREKTLCLSRNELPGVATGAGAGAEPPAAMLGSFDFADGGWPGCPHCGAKYNDRKQLYLLWACNHPGCGGPLHCVGDRRRLFRCACGIAADYNFAPVASLDVRGASARETTNTGRSPGRSALPALAGPNARLTLHRK